MKSKKHINDEDIDKIIEEILNKKPPNKKKHLEDGDRIVIEKMLSVGHPQKEIARTLQRGESTISEEIKRGRCPDGIYRAEEAKRRSKMRQYYKKQDCLKVSMYSKLQKYVNQQIEKGVSPEDIAEETRNEKSIFQSTSGKAIRKFIHKRRPNLEVNFFWNRNNKRGGPKRVKGKYLKDLDRKFIEQREVDLGWLFNLEYGHWEGDFVVSKHNSFVLLVLVERSSKLTLIEILPNRNNIFVNKRIVSLLKNYKVKSLTLDNDIAFQKWKNLEKKLNCNIYFTHPYCSWEKGLVENTNRWIREFVPKKSDIKKITKEKIQSIQNWWNNKPRKVLDGNTSFEVMILEEKNVRISSILPDFPVVNNSY